MLGPAKQRELEAIVARYCVCYEVWPLRELYHGRSGAIGFEIDLAGTHEKPGHISVPGCDACKAVYDGLRRIARAIIPVDTQSSRVDILPFDGCIHASRARFFRDDIELHMHVVHRLDRELPIDAGERACLHEITEELRHLGVRAVSWIV